MKRVHEWLFLCLLLVPTTLGQTNPAAPRTFMVEMRDGVQLATDVYLPSTESAVPVVLMRTPYNKTNIGGMAASATKAGYALVSQDTRGRFASEGENLPFNVDDKDGFDTMQWLEKQGWCNGKIGTVGGSALGITQLQLAGTGVAGLACQHITVAAPNLYDVVYNGGVFRKALVEDWLRGSKFSPKALEIWTGHPAYDAYWQQRDVTRRYKKVNAPAVHIGGYFDLFAQGTIDAFNGFQTRGGPGARGKQKLLMGPWTHGVLTDKAGELVFPNAKTPPNHVQDQMRWFDCYLKGIVNGVAELPAVTYYVMGDVSDPQAPGNVWRTADQWPPLPTTNQRWYLQEDQTLSTLHPTQHKTVTYIYDPLHPAPTVGGYELTIPAGPRDQKEVEARPDVVVFTSAPLTNALEVIGQVRVKLYFSTDVPDSDFIARLCDVYPDGRSFNICEGMIRARYRESFSREEFLKPGKIYALNLDLWPTSIVFNKGHRLRVDVTSSSVPGYDPNPNTDQPFRWGTRTEVAHHTLYTATHYASVLELPVVEKAR